MEQKQVKVAAIQESKLTSNSRCPNIQSYTTVRKDRPNGQGGGLLFFIHESVNFTRKPASANSRNDPHLEEQTIVVKMDNTELLITNIYIPPSSSCNTGYQPSWNHLLMHPDALVLGDFNAHHTSWYSKSTDVRGNQMVDLINSSNFGILNWDTPTRLPSNATPSSPDVSLASASLIASTNWQTLTTMGSDHLPILIRLQTTVQVSPAKRRTYVNLKRANWERYEQEIEDKLDSYPQPENCQKDEKIFRNVLLKAASHHIPSGRHRVNPNPVPAEILAKMTERDELRKQDPSSPDLHRLNNDITRAISNHKQQKWREFVETLDNKTDNTKLWRTIKGIEGEAKPQAENESISFNGTPSSSPKRLADNFNRQFTTSKLGSHSSTKETRTISREVRRKSLEDPIKFTTAQVTSAIKSCSNSRAFGPDKLSIFHLKHLGPKAMVYLTALFNDSVSTCRLPAIWKTSLVIPLPKPGKDTSLGISYRPISLLCPAAKVLEALVLPNLKEHLSPAHDQHGFRARHSTTSALLQLTTDIATGFNQRKPPERTVCVAVDLTAAFDTVCHNILVSKISKSTLPPSLSRWMSCYLRGRQAYTSFRGVTSSKRIVHSGVPQGSKLSPTLFSFYIADMPRPTEPIKRVCYADDITVWASGVKIPPLETMIDSYLRELSVYLTDNSLLISAPKSTVTLFSPDPAQAKTHPQITLDGAILPLVRQPKILGVTFDTSLAFHHHCNNVAARIDKRNNVLKALAGTSWGQQKETLLMTYKAIGSSIANYAAPVWSPNASSTSLKKIQTAQNAALRVVTGAHLMSNIDHLHQESKMMRIEEHSELLSAQYLVNCLEEDHVCHGITTRTPPPRQMKATLHSKHFNTVEPLLDDTSKKKSLQQVHTSAVEKAINKLDKNKVLDDRPPPISREEESLTRRQRTTLSQLRSGYCHLLGSYKHRLNSDNSDSCADCGTSPQDVEHLFACTAHPTVLTLKDLWLKPADSIREFGYLDQRNLD